MFDSVPAFQTSHTPDPKQFLPSKIHTPLAIVTALCYTKADVSAGYTPAKGQGGHTARRVRLTKTQKGMMNCMKNMLLKRILSLTVAAVMLTAAVLGMTSCEKLKREPAATTHVELVKPVDIGEGANFFTFSVTFYDGTIHVYYVHTDETTVGEALKGVDLISGEYGPYGLYVKTVDGETLDYDIHQKYWAFYIDGVRAEMGVDRTEIVQGLLYAFRAE